MQTVVHEPADWIDGFLFVANRRILDFVNTKPVLAEGATELLPDVAALERWLIVSGIANSAKTKRLIRGWRDTRDAVEFHRDLLAFRERLRAAVLRLEAGSAPADAFLHEVNEGLRQHPPTTGLRKVDGRIVREPTFDPQRVEDLWTPFFDGAAELLSEPEIHRLRKCEACVVHFVDTSKKGARRWCSMNICGNKLKVAAYQRRQRDSNASA